MKIIQISVAALLVFSAAALAGIGPPEVAGGASDEPRTGITVTGTGQVQAVPDEAEFSLGVSTKGRTAREALAANSEQMNQLIDALKAAGIPGRDLRTQHVSVSRAYDESAGGYAAENSVLVLLRDLNRAGTVLDVASRAGANSLYGPTMSRSDRESFETEALKKAVENARDRASTLADAAGVSLGEVTAIVESSQSDAVPYLTRAESNALAAKPPIEAGTEEITAVVSVTYAIR